VAHGDGSRDNNHVTNLRWATRRENAADAARHGTLARGSRNGLAKTDEDSVVEVRRLAAMGVPRAVLAKQFGMSKQMVGNVVARRYWKHVPAEIPALASEAQPTVGENLLIRLG
jgi:hypothetical protein